MAVMLFSSPFSRGSAPLLRPLLLIALLAGLLSPPEAAAQEESGGKLPLPRFVSLRSAEANARTGPGVRYPVEWVFVRKDIPLEITAEFENWRKVRDWQGSEGWVHRSMLYSRRSLVVTGEKRFLRAKPSLESSVAGEIEPGVFGEIKRCERDWCEVSLAGYEGWLQRFEFWGIYPDEKLD